MGMADTDVNMARICTIAAAVGIALIFGSSYFGSSNEVELASIGKNMIGENIVSCGIAESLPKESKNGDALFLKLGGMRENSNGSITVVFFKNEMHAAKNISRGSKICVEGNVAVFGGNIEIIAKRAALADGG